MIEDDDDYIPFEGPSRPMTPDERAKMASRTRALDDEILVLLQKQWARRRARSTVDAEEL